MNVNGLELTNETHEDIIRAIVFELIEIANFDINELTESYKKYLELNPKENQHACDMPIQD